MPRYFFHLKDHVDRLLDPVGRTADPDDVPELALAEARALISQDALTGVLNLDQRIEVENESGEMVHTLHFKEAIVIRGRD